MKKTFVLLAMLAAASGALAQKTLTIYTGRSAALVEPLINQYQTETGTKILVKYGKDAELVATLQEEGKKSPADIFWANTSGALGAVNTQLKVLPKSILAKPKAFVPNSKTWVPISTRMRVLAYNKDKYKPNQFPESILELPKRSEFKGKIGWTPSYSSFQDFVATLILMHGEAKTKQWLLDMKALEPKTYAANPPMMEAIKSGEIDLALTNHYYIQRYLKVGYPIGTYYFQKGDAGSLALVTGAGVLKTSKNASESIKFINWLLTPRIQQFFPGELFEFPLVNKVVLSSNLNTLEDTLVRSPKIDFEKLQLDDALRLLREVGLL